METKSMVWNREIDDDDVTKKQRLEEEEARDRSWDRAVDLAVEAMREPERREWFRDQRIQEEQEAKNAGPDNTWGDVSVSDYFD
jgi:hypothetical protein